MKCPHCNQEHPEGTRYCPMTGNKILLQLQSCPNPTCDNFSRSVIPPNYLYCPICGLALRETPPPPPSIGSDIAFNDIILGQTSLQTLRNRNIEVQYDHGSYFALLSEEHMIFATILRVRPDELDGWIENYKSPNKEFFLNRERLVNSMTFSSLNRCPILNDMNITARSNEDEMVDLLDENGWMRIEGLFMDDEEEATYDFVRILPDTVGNRIFLHIGKNCDLGGKVGVAFFVNCMTEWKSYNTGKVFRL